MVQRGLAWQGTLANKLVYAGNSLGAWNSMAEALLLAYAAAKRAL